MTQQKTSKASVSALRQNLNHAHMGKKSIPSRKQKDSDNIDAGFLMKRILECAWHTKLGK